LLDGVPMTASERRSQSDDLERDTDTAIKACGGDARTAVRALLLANAFLESELARAFAKTSAGYARRSRGLLNKPTA